MVITGIGAITPIGLGVEGLWEGLRAADLGGPLHHPLRSDRVQVAHRGRGGRLRADATTSRSGARAGSTATPSSPSPPRAWRWPTPSSTCAREDPDRVGAMMGTALGGVAHGEGQLPRLPAPRGRAAVDPALALTVFAGAASCNIAIEFGCTGPNSTNGMSCASGAIAIGDGFRAIVRRRRRRDAGRRRRGAARPALLRRLRHHPRHVHPQRRSGARQPPVRRGARRLRDGGGRGGAGAGGAGPGARARRADLRRGVRLRPDQRRPPHDRAAARRQAGRARHARVRWPRPTWRRTRSSYINAHGSSTPLNDPTETARSSRSSATRAYRVPLSGTKGYYGHALGASGAIEAAICALAARRGWLPPTVNLETPDAACDLPHVTGDGPRPRARGPAQQLVRLRRHQRGAGVSAGRTPRFAAVPTPCRTSQRIADAFVASPLGRRSHRYLRRWSSSASARSPPSTIPTPTTASSASRRPTPSCCRS